MTKVKSFKNFIKAQDPISLEVINFPKKVAEKVAEKVDEGINGPTDKNVLASKNSAGLNKHNDLHARLSDHYEFDEDDKKQIQIFMDYAAEINKALLAKNKPKKEVSKSKPAPKISDDDKKFAANVDKQAKELDAMLGGHTSPSADFNVYVPLKKSPTVLHQETSGQKHDGKAEIQAVLHAFTTGTIMPNVSKDLAVKPLQFSKDKTAHIIKLKIPAGSKHGAYLGGKDDPDRKFLMKSNRKMTIAPEPEDHEYTDKHGKKNPVKIWHAELEG